MYCTVQDVITLLPENVTVGDQNIGTPVPGKCSTTGRSKITPDEIIEFIKFAQQEVDARLRPIYVCPLRRIKIHETGVLNYAPSGSNVKISVHDSGPFAKNQLIRLQSECNYEESLVSDVKNLDQIVVSKTISDYDSQSLISILEYPDPIPLMTARLAVSYLFDRLFAAEQSPDVSNYGNQQRKMAMFSMDSILSGTVILMGQEHITKRFVRVSLFDSYKTPTDDIQFGRESQ